ncbi:MAG: hypothetical protein JWN52_5010 [Actinomycetia bacterium]|nr:hypothetical protein [Actinomycetes bacterium]
MIITVLTTVYVAVVAPKTLVQQVIAHHSLRRRDPHGLCMRHARLRQKIMIVPGVQQVVILVLTCVVWAAIVPFAMAAGVRPWWVPCWIGCEPIRQLDGWAGPVKENLWASPHPTTEGNTPLSRLPAG